MRKCFMGLALSFATLFASAQNLTGTWGGITYTSLDRYAQHYYIFLEVKQIGRDVWALYNITDTNNNTISKCLSKIHATLPKKAGSRIEFYKDGLVSYDREEQLFNTCDFLAMINMHYFIDGDSTEYITGTAHGTIGSPQTTGNGNNLVLQRMSNKTLRDITDYFPVLINKQDNGETGFIKPDKVTTALAGEKRLLSILKTMLEKNESLVIKRRNKPVYTEQH